MENLTTTEYKNTIDILNILRKENEVLKHKNIIMVNSLETKENRINSLNSSLKNERDANHNFQIKIRELKQENLKLNEKITNMEMDHQMENYHKRRK